MVATTVCLVGCGKKSPNQPAQSTFVGIGVQLSVKDRQVVIVSVLPGTPAAKTGLHSGLILQQINGTNILGKPIEQCVFMVRGPIGSKVQLTVLDPVKNETNSVEFIRDKISMSDETSLK